MPFLRPAALRRFVDTGLPDDKTRPRLVLGLLAAIMAVQISPWWYASDDSHSYLSIARSIARGTGPTNLGSRHLWFSPGYPVLISPTYLLDSQPFLAISVCQWLLLVGLIMGVYHWSRRTLGGAAIWIVGLAVVNHALWVHYRRPLSEIAFMCFLVWAVVGLHSSFEAKGPVAFVVRLLPASLLAAAACLIRPVGIVLGPACVVVCCLAAHRGALAWSRAALCSLIVCTATALPVALVAVHERATAGGHDRTYLDEFREAADDLLPSYSRGLQICVSDIGRLCIPGMFKTHGTPGDWTDINMLLHVPFVALVVLGWWRWVRRQDDLLAWCLPFFVALLVAHAIATGARLMLPMLPALLVCFWLAIERLTTRSRRRIVAGVLAAQLFVATGYWLLIDAPRAWRNHRRWAAVDALASEIARDPGAVAADSLPDDADLMLELAMDRRISRGGPAPRGRWLVTSAGASRTEGFVRFRDSSDLTLWRRYAESSTPATRHRKRHSHPP